MAQRWHHRAFSEREHRARLARGKAAMDEAGLQICICTSPELLYYFTGYEAHTHHAIDSQALVLAGGRHDPILILRDGDVPQADETVVIGELRPFRLGAVELADLIAEVVTELNMSHGAIGLDLSGATMNGALLHAVQKRFAGRHFVDCWRLLGSLRTVLSAQEIAYMRQAAGYANAGIDAFYASARPGMSEIELAAETEYAKRSAGSDIHSSAHLDGIR